MGCGVHGAKDFETAQNFQNYVKEENAGQMIPKTCCILKKPLIYSLDSVEDMFIPEDDNCPKTFTVTNSYMNKVCTLYAVDFLIIMVLDRFFVLTSQLQISFPMTSVSTNIFFALLACLSCHSTLADKFRQV